MPAYKPTATRFVSKFSEQVPLLSQRGRTMLRVCQ